MFILVFLFVFGQFENTLSNPGFIMTLDAIGNCYIKISSLNRLQPLFLQNGTYDGEYTFRIVHPVKYPRTSEGERHIRIDKNEGIFVGCPISSDQKALSLEYKYCGKSPELNSDFECSSEITTDSIVTRFTSDECGENNNGKILQAGYNVRAISQAIAWYPFTNPSTEEKYIPVLNICHVDDFSNLFTTIHIDGFLLSNSDLESPISRVVTEMEILSKVYSAIPDDAKVLQKQKCELFLARLVTEKDYYFRTEEKAWEKAGIKILQWNTIHYGEWLNLRNNIKRIAKTFKVKFNVYIGIDGPMKNLGSTSVDKIKIDSTIDSKKFDISLSKYTIIWFERPDTKECTVFAFLNYPKKQTDVPDPCIDRCKDLKWPKGLNLKELSGDFICCSHEDLSKTIKLIPKIECLSLLEWPII